MTRACMVIAVAASLVALALPAPGVAGVREVLSQPVCPEGLAGVAPFKRSGAPALDWRENLAFDGLGGMWVTMSRAERLERYAQSGAVTESVALPGAVGITRGPDGLMYLAAELPGHPGVSVARFDPGADQVSLEPYASGLSQVNGMAFDAEGNLYVSDELGTSVVKILPGGEVDRAWTREADVWGANGLAVAGDALFANITFDQRSPIERVPLADPASHSTLTQLSFGVASLEPAIEPGDPRAPLLPKGLDDLVAAPGGALYLAAFLTGELLRVDRQTGDACVAANGLGLPTSVRFPRAFGAYDEARDLFVTEASGNIRVVRLPG